MKHIEIGNNGIYLVEKTELLRYVDATPDDEYPLRILRAHLLNAEGVEVSDNTAGEPPKDPFCISVNQQQRQRAQILRQAIAKLECYR